MFNGVKIGRIRREVLKGKSGILNLSLNIRALMESGIVHDKKRIFWDLW
jgi:hypothetical protein